MSAVSRVYANIFHCHEDLRGQQAVCSPQQQSGASRDGEERRALCWFSWSCDV